MDSFELNKIAGAVLFALLVLFGTRTATDIIFAVHAPEKPGYEVAIPETGGETPAPGGEQEEPLAVLLASADAGKGQSVAKKCAACHTFDDGGANKIGPNLHGIVGKDIASVSGFSYSDALQSKEGAWSYEDLDAFIANPKGAVPGTKMAFAGIRNSGQRADLILYLRSLGGNPPPLPEPPAKAASADPAKDGAAQQEGAPQADGAASDKSAQQGSDAKSVPAGEAKAKDEQTPPMVPAKPEGSEGEAPKPQQ